MYIEIIKKAVKAMENYDGFHTRSDERALEKFNKAFPCQEDKKTVEDIARLRTFTEYLPHAVIWYIKNVL